MWRAELALKLGDIRLAVDDLVVGNPARNTDDANASFATHDSKNTFGLVGIF